jgi:hypothetical protein
LVERGAQRSMPLREREEIQEVPWRKCVGRTTFSAQAAYPVSSQDRLALVYEWRSDLQTETGIETIIDMIRSLDAKAEIAYDRMDGIQARAAQ